MKIPVFLLQLTRPFSYLSVQHKDKWLYDWLLPAVFTVLTLLIAIAYIPPSNLVGEEGLISEITSFVAGLPGFFIAALAAVATFNRHDIDELMADPAPKIKIIFEGDLIVVEMTRRRFLCVLFAYLTATSILLVLITKIALSTSAVYSEPSRLLAWLGFTGFMFVLWQIVSATALGLYYLGERLHSPQ